MCGIYGYGMERGSLSEHMQLMYGICHKEVRMRKYPGGE